MPRPPTPPDDAAMERVGSHALSYTSSRRREMLQQQRQVPLSHDTPAQFADDDADADADADAESVLDAAEKLPYSKWRCIALVATVTGASFINTLSVQSIVIILPSIGRDLAIPDTRLQWLVSAYALTFGCFLLLWGRIADLFGKKAIFVAGSAWVTATTVANPFIPNEIAFNVFRGLQGLGAAANVPTALGILGTTFPPGKAKNYAFTAYGAGAPLGSIFGNLLSGLIATYASWKWVFGVLAILAGVVTLVGYLIIPPDAHPAGEAAPLLATLQSVDWLGALLVTLGLVGLLFALTEGNVVGWATPWVGAIIGLSLLLVAAFVAWQYWLERPHNVARQRAGRAWPPPPLVRLSIFARSAGPFGAALVIMALFFSSFNGYLVYATYFYQDYQGLSPLQTTLRFIPTGIAGIATSVVVAQLLSRVPTYLLLLLGNACVSASSLLLAVPIPARTTSYFAYGLEAMVLSVMGADTAWPSLTLFASHCLPREDQALGGALVNMAGQVGRTIGLAIATAAQTAVMAARRHVAVADVGPTRVHDDATLAGLRTGCWFNFALGVCSFVVVLAAFRGSGIVGKIPDRPAPAAGLRRPAAAPAGGQQPPSAADAARDAEKALGDGAAPPKDSIGVAVSKD